LAERGYFVREMNCGINEWLEAKLPQHEERPPKGEVRCSCSLP
jgi:hypothetical protein